MKDPFRNTNPNRQVNLRYTLFDGKDDVVMRGISLLEFILCIEHKTLEEASEYCLVPCQQS